MKHITAFKATAAIRQILVHPAPLCTPASFIGSRCLSGFTRSHCTKRTCAFCTHIRNTNRNQRMTAFQSREDDKSQSSNNCSHNYKQSKNRQRKRDPIMDSIAKDRNPSLTLVESSASFLFKCISLPSILSTHPGINRNIEVPLVYILSVIGLGTIIPLLTWILLTAFFGVYLALGTAFIDEYKVLGNEIDDINQEEYQYNGIIYLAAFAGAITSAGLLSPQGLATKASFSLAAPVAGISLVLGGVTLVMGILANREDEIRLEENDLREQCIQDERRQLDLWDDEIKRSTADQE